MTTRIVLALATLFSTCSLLRADLLLFDDFSYPDGNITNNTQWTRHSGGNGDSMVAGGKYQINQSRTDDVNRPFTQPNPGGTVYASFTINVSQLPTSAGAYFAHFKDETTSNFLARVFVTTTNTVLPGTYRVGVANAASAPKVVYPMDLATNADYQLVVSYDPVMYVSTLQVNPVTASDLTVTASDVLQGAVANAFISTYAFRQSTGMGVLTVDGLLVGTTFADVATNPVTPLIVVQPQGGKAYAGSDLTLYIVARGAGQVNYQWRRNGVNVGTDSNILLLSGVNAGDAGSYDVMVSTSNGSATSQAAVVTVDDSPNPPQITSQPVSVTNSVGSSASFKVAAEGRGPFTYTWKFNGNALTDGNGVAGSATNLLTINPLLPSNAGSYQVEVRNQFGNTASSAAYLAVLPPLATNIAYLHTLLDSVTWLPTNTTALYDVTGVVTTYTNITTAANAQFYIQDATGGITVFISGGSTFRPAAGDRVRVVGPLAQFNSLLELAPLPTNPLHVFEILSSGNPLPTPRGFALGQTNDVRYMEQIIEGSLVALTNVYFAAANGTAVFAPNANYTVTNSAGESAVVRVDTRVTSMAGVQIPTFAYQVVGVMGQFLSGSNPPRNTGYQLMITRPEDIIQTPLVNPSVPPTDLVVQSIGPNVVLTWKGSDQSSYSVEATDDLAKAFTPITTGIKPTNGTATYEDPATLVSRFYRVRVQ